ncbi:CAAX amino terminal protease family protein [Gracilibacillus boraciitolerans JCM 21714]|uniref:CAAX amino terminal protease family protein n=1 Tax=Gracilibacillus boraciitolerans JCM 21714 TaxID=1298598 RepID=W4VEU5_9BACI|nr:CPBP family intramembrane glutamic endopeptidase [Gracilibacillus boraciitolerans]GAE91333.1 CAAX amino terminal protease family protein [Gracilibacillus boraciitolerans JCM 21714]
MKQAEIIKHLSNKQLKQQVWLSQLLMIIIAIILSIIFFDNWNVFLSLFQLTLSDFLIFGVGSAVVIVFLDILMMRVFPKNWWDDGGINQKLFQEGSYFEIILLCVVVAISEEWLFRGVIQTNFGIMIASSIFAIIHVRYLSKLLLFTAVVALSFWLGLVYHWTNSLPVVIMLHFLINVTLAIMIRTGGNS